MNKLPDNVPTICIPHVDNTITVNDVQEAFKRFDIGEITYIRVIPRDTYSCVFVHLEWATHKKAKKIRKRLMNHKAVRYLYGKDLEMTPWFWKCVATKSSLNEYAYIKDCK